jgi:putative membrane protein (TIGR04086 family)
VWIIEGGGFFMRQSGASGQKTVLFTIRAVVIGSVVGALVCALLLACLAFAFVSAESIPHNFLSAFILAVIIISSFVAGIVTVKITKQRGLLCGSAAGLLLFLIFFIAGVAASQGHTSAEVFMRLIMMLLSGGIGGLLAVNGKSRRN